MGTGDLTQYWLTRFCFQRFLGFVYLIAFLVTLHQFRPLIGEQGLLPVPLFLNRVKFWEAPSLFWIEDSDRFLSLLAWGGVILSLLAVTGLSDAFGMGVSVTVWALLWLFYLSFVNVGQVFYGFGWETLLLETGFLAIFLGSSETAPPRVIFWLLRWVLFRVMFGAALIKLRGDPCWRDLTCLEYHYETQPLPNPLSWYFHQGSPVFHKGGVLFTHLVELIVPWGVFAPQPLAYGAGALMIVFQGILILSGNLSWLNYVTIVLCVACFDDRLLSRLLPMESPVTPSISGIRQGVLLGLTVLILILSIPPTLNLLSPRQIMNTSFEPLHLVNTYGAFGSVTKTRMEIIVQGTEDRVLDESTQWREYEFKAKPGNVRRTPPVVSPYHYRLDWLMWFAAMSDYSYHPWFLNLVAKLLQGDRETLKLLAVNPFPKAPPQYIRAELYEYHFTRPAEKRKSGHGWSRTRWGEYLPPLSLDHPAFRDVLRRAGWLP